MKQRQPAPVAQRYMVDFQCLGAACEDQCCSGWQVPVDQAHYSQLRKTLSRSAADHGRFTSAVALVPAPQRTRDHFALIQLTAASQCPFLTEGRLCQIHADHGPQLLPDACAMYPRTIARVGGRLELSGSLSCPEVARRALLQDHAGSAQRSGAPSMSMEWTEVAPAQLARAVVQDEVDDGPTGLLALRRSMCRLLTHPGASIDSQLFFTAFAAEQVRDWGTGDGLDRLLTAEVLAQIDRRFQSSRRDTPLPLSLLLGVLGTRVQRTGNAFHQLVLTVMQSYAAEPDGGVWLADDPAAPYVDLHIDLTALGAVYLRRRARVLQRHADRVAGYLRNYALSCWQREHPPAPAEAPAHAQGLLLRLSLLRFLILGHPAALAALAEPDPAAATAALDRVAVTAVYSFARILDHHRPFADGLTELARRHLGGLGTAVSLLSI